MPFLCPSFLCPSSLVAAFFAGFASSCRRRHTATEPFQMSKLRTNIFYYSISSLHLRGNFPKFDRRLTQRQGRVQIGQVGGD